MFYHAGNRARIAELPKQFIYYEVHTINYYACPKTSTEKSLNVLLKMLMRMEHFKIVILKLILKIISRKLMVQLN